MMKKTYAVLSVAAIALSLTATPALAKGHGHDDNNGKHLGDVFGRFDSLIKKSDDDKGHGLASDQFVLTGTVGSATTGSIVITVKGSVNVPTLTNNLATVNVDANTKYFADKNQTVTLTDVKAGQQIVVSGTVSGSTLTAKNVRIIFPKGKVYGEVTAKTDTSITIKNNVTGTTQTFTTDANTKVNIDGEAKTQTDVKVGDKGFVKFKTTLSGMVAKVINLFR
jgi:hypothetical protein